MKKILCCILLLFVLTPTVFAANDIDYTGEIDKYTGEIVDKTEESQKNIVPISGDLRFDREKRMFLYETAAGNIYSTIADGMIDNEVSIFPDEGVRISYYRDGTEVNTRDFTLVHEPGNYVVRVGRNGSNVTDEVMRFIITDSVTNRLSDYRLPSGFAFTKVLFNDEPIRLSYSNFVDLSVEGEYRMEYACTATGVSYSLDVEIDRTAPVLELDGVTDGKADGPVDISCDEENVTFAMRFGKETITPTNHLEQSGTYTVSVMDPAGNINTYNFTIRIYFNNSAVTFLVLLALLIVSFGGFILLTRKKVRVR